MAQPAPILQAATQASARVSPPVAQSTFDVQPTQSSAAVELPVHQKSGEDVIATLERLGGLMEKGYITNEEFAAKKSELLNRL